MSETRTSFPPVFWVANLIEVMERFAYYGIYFGFGIYMTQELGLSPEKLGWVQFIFLLPVSYTHLTLPTNTNASRSPWSPNN